MQVHEKKVWLVTGVSKGLGKALAAEALNSNHIVVGTVRRPEDLEVFEQTHESATGIIFDQSHVNSAHDVVQKVIRIYGKIDVLVNNAGYGLIGYVEEASIEEVKRQMDVNFFSVLRLTQSVLPYMRKVRSGHIIQISSRLGIVSPPGMGIYAASKFALEALSEALAKEVAPFNVKVSLIEPGPLRTEFFGLSSQSTERDIIEYHASPGGIKQANKERNGKQDGDPVKAAKTILHITQLQDPPMRFPLTEYSVDAMRQKTDEYTATLQLYEKMAIDVKLDQ